VSSEERNFSAISAVQGHSRSMILVPIESAHAISCYSFIVTLGPTLHRFWDTTIYWLKIANFSCPTFIRRPIYGSSLWKFAVKFTMRKQESSFSEDRMIVAW